MNHDIDNIVEILRTVNAQWREPIITEMVKHDRDPFKVLISTILSLRTKDEVTREASRRLFAHADTPGTLMTLPVETIETAIFPVGFYHTKARTVREVSALIVNQYGGLVPDTVDELLTIKGVGRKTANLVVTLGHNGEGICVDTHVHRIMNRLGYVTTNTPKQTEFALRDKLPKRYWTEVNDLLVTFGQNMCKPVSPLCSNCPLHDRCARVGVTVHR